jgi:hypothetical protein
MAEYVKSNSKLNMLFAQKKTWYKNVYFVVKDLNPYGTGNYLLQNFHARRMAERSFRLGLH